MRHMRIQVYVMRLKKNSFLPANFSFPLDRFLYHPRAYGEDLESLPLENGLICIVEITLFTFSDGSVGCVYHLNILTMFYTNKRTSCKKLGEC